MAKSAPRDPVSADEVIPASILKPLRECPEFTDFPTAWAIQHDRGPTLKHHERCSCVPGWDPVSGPGFLCDCGAVTKEWERLRELDPIARMKLGYLQREAAYEMQSSLRRVGEAGLTLTTAQIKTLVETDPESFGGRAFLSHLAEIIGPTASKRKGRRKGRDHG